MNRGSNDVSAYPLSQSRSFNEAPIHESGKSAWRLYEVVGIGRPSMRPRFMNRGSARDMSGWHSGGVPSMRPRFMNRGSTIPSDG